MYEETVSGSWKVYLDDFAIISFSQESGYRISYLHKDRLGSALTFSDDQGQVVGRRHYDAFGKPRTMGGQQMEPGYRPRLANVMAFGGIENIALTRRGFTDHLHLDELELIHMNGRVYDYNLGRFMSVDPFVHEGSQGINPYSYIMNNPLSGIDPTGYSPEEPELEKVEYTEQTEKVAVTGSRIKREVVTGASGTATYSNGATQSFSATFSGGKVATMDIGSPKQTSTTSLQTQQGGSSVGETVKGVAQAVLKSLKKGGVIGMALAPTSTATDEQMEALAQPIIEENILHNTALDLEPELSKEDYARLENDLANIRTKPNGPNGIQYALIAEESGDYICYNCSSGVMWLNEGDVWKYGQTTKPATRYSEARLNGGLAGRRLSLEPQYRGTQRQVLLAEKLKIYTHLAKTGTLPPGNKIRR
ncbi:RHS repeat-associated core domain-containing protein [Pseudidiomarina sediminum]|nr:RHS repeat-associated core domain-containing protein [Pseudidiomarina sediminum]